MTKIAHKARTRLTKSDKQVLEALGEDIDYLRTLRAARTGPTPCPREVDYHQSIRRRLDHWNALHPLMPLPRLAL